MVRPSDQKRPRPMVLIVLDGWGIRREREGNAIALAGAPFYHGLLRDYASLELTASGESVGLPDEQMGNSEVGHLNLGAGRVVYQELTRINRSVSDGSFASNPVLCRAVDAATAPGATLHLLGLLSDGGVHSHIEHVFALLAMAKRRGARRVAVHAFLDGRDTPPQSGVNYLRTLEARLATEGIGRLATVSGRYYAMDRDKRWDRVQKAYDAIVAGQGVEAKEAVGAVEESYRQGVTDEFVVPIVLTANGQPTPIRDGDSAIFFNFRADRARQLTAALIDDGFDGFPRSRRVRFAEFVGLTRYDDRLAVSAAYEPVRLTRILADVLSDRGLRQLRIAETEKYAHVTYFFNGGVETVYPGEDRILIPSPRDVATYDQRPAMSAVEVTDTVVAKVASGAYDFMLINYANPDMVGHTGDLAAAIEAVRVIDACLERVVAAVLAQGGAVLLTADHGNLEQMFDDTGGPHTAHTTNPVPCILIDARLRLDAADRPAVRARGVFADVAPTLLALMGIPQPPEMTGRSLVAVPSA
ncbi:MAG: 2,3-bisphosphoglycerate-independent phosphoglycerate mutase [Nitrospirota bacterium]